MLKIHLKPLGPVLLQDPNKVIFCEHELYKERRTNGEAFWEVCLRIICESDIICHGGLSSVDETSVIKVTEIIQLSGINENPQEQENFEHK